MWLLLWKERNTILTKLIRTFCIFSIKNNQIIIILIIFPLKSKPQTWYQHFFGFFYLQPLLFIHRIIETFLPKQLLLQSTNWVKLLFCLINWFVWIMNSFILQTFFSSVFDNLIPLQLIIFGFYFHSKSLVINYTWVDHISFLESQ